jgi:hypothetical protein
MFLGVYFVALMNILSLSQNNLGFISFFYYLQFESAIRIYILEANVVINTMS